MRNQHVLISDEVGPGGGAENHLVLPPPSVEPAHHVFAETMLEDSSVRQRRSPLDWLVSLTVHIAILGVLLILPLYYRTGLNVQKLNLTFLATPPPAPPPPPLNVTAAPRAVRNVPAHVYIPGKLTAPSFIPRVVSTTPSESAPAEAAPAGIIGGVPGGIPGGQVGGVFGGVLGGALKNLPAPAPVAERPKVPVQVGGRVKPPRLLSGPDPEYPALARMSRISGNVVIEAIIDEHGNVTGMRAISGPPLLIPAALSAVSKRKYEPTVLDGEATPVDLRVEVTFSLG